METNTKRLQLPTNQTKHNKNGKQYYKHNHTTRPMLTHPLLHIQQKQNRFRIPNNRSGKQTKIIQKHKRCCNQW